MLDKNCQWYTEEYRAQALEAFNIQEQYYESILDEVCDSVGISSEVFKICGNIYSQDYKQLINET